MAKMLPSVIAGETKSTAEQRIFEWFRNAPGTDDWFVLHSLGVSKHKTLISGEIDFLVIAPGLGLFVLEVKGGRVSRKDGIWTFMDRNGHSNSNPRGPFDQAKESMYSLLDFLKTSLDDNVRESTKSILGYGVMFPDIIYEASGFDEEQWQVFDSRDEANVADFIRKLYSGFSRKWIDRYGTSHIGLSRDSAKAVASKLRGDFDKSVPLGVKLRNSENKTIKLTNEQENCLEQLSDNERLLVKGSAGTGKTLLAIKEALKLSGEGCNVAFFCFNNNLGEWLKEQIKKEDSNYKPSFIGTFHSFMLKFLKDNGVKLSIPHKPEEAETFFKMKIPEIINKLFGNSCRIYDAIVVDEAQDLIEKQYLQVINSVLKGGLSKGRWVMFGDFEHQAIYSERNPKELLSILSGFGQFSSYRLTYNCRNTQPICSEIQIVSGVKSQIKGRPSITEELPVQYCPSHNEGDQLKSLNSIIENLLSDGVRPEDITILSPRKFENSIAGRVVCEKVCEYSIKKRNCITFSTIQGFKGLENSIVILIEVNGYARVDLMYVAYSRARSCLYVLENNGSCTKLWGFRKRVVINR